METDPRALNGLILHPFGITDINETVLEINVDPFQPKHFTASHAGDKGKRHHRTCNRVKVCINNTHIAARRFRSNLFCGNNDFFLDKNTI